MTCSPRALLPLPAALLVLLGGCQSRPAAVASPHSVDADRVEALLRSEMRKRRIPGLQVAIVRQGALVLSGAYGIANLQDSIPVTPQSVFGVNSITKAFVGVAVMQLAEEGKLDVDAPVSRYLDGLPAPWRPVRIRQLLNHTSGLPNIMSDDGKLAADGAGDTAWVKVQTMPMEFAPGARFAYNQTGYVVLGKIIDKLAGRPFTQFITERQFRVVGMPATERSGFSDSHDVIPHHARGYTTLRRDDVTNVFEEFPPYLRTAAGLSSTAEEMAKWIVALQRGKLLTKAGSLETLWTPATVPAGSAAGFSELLNGYALGFPIVGRREHRAVAAVGGARSALFIYPDDDLAVVVLTNLQGAFPESFIDEVARLARGE